MSPDEIMKKEFYKRLRGGLVIDPIPLQCIIGSFNAKAIDVYAERGDVAAKLSRAYVRLDRNVDPCANRYLVNEIVEVAEFSEEYGEGKVYKIPEAAAVLENYYSFCNGIESVEAIYWRKSAWSGGFDRASSRPEVRE